MAINKGVLNFSFRFKGGATTPRQVVMNLGSGPVLFSIGPDGPAGFDLLQTIPSECYGLTVNGGLEIANFTFVSGVLTLTLAADPVVNDEYQVTGIVAF